MSPDPSGPPGKPRDGRGTIVEFVGLPGSGKSTLSQAVAGVLRRGEVPVSVPSYEFAHRMRATARRLTKLRLVGRAILRRPRSGLALALQIIRIGQRNWLKGAAKALELLYLCGLVAERSRRPGIHLLDQGFFTAIWSICFGASSAAPIDRLVESGIRCCGRSPSDLVIFLEVSPPTAVERLRRRPGRTSRLEQSMATAAFERDLEAAVVSLRRLRETLCAGQGRWKLRFVSEGEPGTADTLAAEIAAQMIP